MEKWKTTEDNQYVDDANQTFTLNLIYRNKVKESPAWVTVHIITGLLLKQPKRVIISLKLWEIMESLGPAGQTHTTSDYSYPSHKNDPRREPPEIFSISWRLLCPPGGALQHLHDDLTALGIVLEGKLQKSTVLKTVPLVVFWKWARAPFLSVEGW